MKKRLLGVLLATATFFGATAQKIVAYYPYYASSASTLPYNKITDIFYGFIGTNGSGSLTASCSKDAGGNETVFEQAEWNTLRDLASAQGVNVHIAVGGANITNHLANSANGSSRSTLVSDIVKFVAGNHSLNSKRIKGVDIDWEFPDNSTEIANHLLLCQDLRAALDVQGNTDGVHYDLSIAVGGTSRNMPGTFATYHDDFLNTDVFEYIDFLNCMNYDLAYIDAYGNHNSPVAGAEAVVERYVTNGIDGVKLPAEKFILGVPFYGKGGWADPADGIAYKDFASTAYLNDVDGDLNGHKYNSKPMLEAKADLICQKGLGGFLIWEITQDDASYSLLNSMNDRFTSSCSQYTCQSPVLGADQTVCGESVELDANITLASGESIAWYKNNTKINDASSVTYSVSEAATYKAVVTTSAGCEKFDEIVLTTGGDLTVIPGNLGFICEDYEYSQSIDVTVNGGGGFYNLYDAATGGTKIKSVTGSSFPITVADVAANDQRTYYVEEPAGQTASVGPTGPYTNGTAGWPFYDPNSVVLDNGVEYDQNWTMQITTYSAITIQSIDFIFGYDSGQDNDNLHVNVYDALGTIVISKDIELSAIDFSTAVAGNQFLNTITVDLELPTAGNYEVAFGGTNTLMWMEKDWFSPSPSPTWPYIGEISGANVISMTGTGNTDEDYSWDLTGNVVGMYNWVVSTGTGSSSCGRVPFTVYHDCVGVTSTKEVLTTEFKVYPNPAVNNLNVSFEVSKSIDAKVELINSLGSIVSIKNLGIVSAGNQTVKVPTSGLAEGVYLVKVTTGNAFTTRMITIAK
jgi:GH18 family chitinase